jgi:hypothetical protein
VSLQRIKNGMNSTNLSTRSESITSWFTSGAQPIKFATNLHMDISIFMKVQTCGFLLSSQGCPVSSSFDFFFQYELVQSIQMERLCWADSTIEETDTTKVHSPKFLIKKRQSSGWSTEMATHTIPHTHTHTPCTHTHITKQKNNKSNNNIRYV